jgi:hypothetical protein
MYRFYRYQTNCLAHIPGMPKAGDLVLQCCKNGQWRNLSWPHPNPNPDTDSPTTKPSAGR